MFLKEFEYKKIGCFNILMTQINLINLKKIITTTILLTDKSGVFFHGLRDFIFERFKSMSYELALMKRLYSIVIQALREATPTIDG